MAHPRYETLQGFVLHRQPIGESHYRLTLLTRQHGKVICFLKGATPEGARQFEMKTSFSGEHYKASDFRYTDALLVHSASAKYFLLYINELTYLLAQQEAPDEQFYACYMSTLIQLNKSAEENRALRFFELSLLDYLGQSINFQTDSGGNPIAVERQYNYAVSKGFQATNQGSYTGEQVIAAGQLKMDIKGAMSCVRECARQQLEVCLDGRFLNSRHWLTKPKGQPAS